METEVGEMEIKTEEETVETEASEELTGPAPEASPVKMPTPVKVEPKQERKQHLKTEVPPKPRKLLSLQYNYSDSEDEETREDRKARIVSLKACIVGPVYRRG